MKRKKRILRCVKALLPVVAVLLIACLFFSGLKELDAGQSDQGIRQLEQAIRRAAVSCYAAEGRYPPEVSYMQQYYGVQIDESRYIVHYRIFAENLMPDITVTVKTQ